MELVTQADAEVRGQYGGGDIDAIVAQARTEWEGLEPAAGPEEYEKTRLALGKLRNARTKVEAKRKELKAAHLEAGRRIDSVAKHLTGLIEPIEEKLSERKRLVDDAAAKVKLDAEIAKRLEQEAAEKAERDKADAARRAELEAEAARQEETRKAQEAESARLADEKRKNDEATAELKRKTAEVEAEAKRMAKAENDRLMEQARADKAKRDAETKAAREKEAKEKAERERKEAEAAAAAAAAAEKTRAEALRPDAEKLAAFSDSVTEALKDHFAAVKQSLSTDEGAQALVAAAVSIAEALIKLKNFGAGE